MRKNKCTRPREHQEHHTATDNPCVPCIADSTINMSPSRLSKEETSRQRIVFHRQFLVSRILRGPTSKFRRWRWPPMRPAEPQLPRSPQSASPPRLVKTLSIAHLKHPVAGLQQFQVYESRGVQSTNRGIRFRLPQASKYALLTFLSLGQPLSHGMVVLLSRNFVIVHVCPRATTWIGSVQYLWKRRIAS